MATLKTFPELNTLFTRAAAKFAELPAFTQYLANGLHGTLSYEETERAALKLASYLSEEVGLRPGERIAFLLPNILAYPVSLIAAFRIGCIAVNINPQSSEREILDTLRDSGARLLVALDLFLDRLVEVHRETSVRLIITATFADFMPLFSRMLIHTNLAFTHRFGKTTISAIALADAIQDIEELGRTTRYELDNPVLPHSPALLQYTDGITGINKGALLTHANLASNVEQFRIAVHSRLSHGAETLFSPLPLSNLFAFTVNFLLFYSSGAHTILLPRYRDVSDARPVLEHQHVTWISGLSNLFSELTRQEWFHAAPPQALKIAISWGSTLREPLASRWSEITGTQLITGYGLCEASPVVCTSPLDEISLHGSIGKPIPFTDVTILDEKYAPLPPGEVGELAVRGPQVMREYWRHPIESERTIRNGWLLTGDIATLDAKGFCRILGRKRDVIQIADLHVYPDEVENIIATIPGVAEVAIVGIPCENEGQRVHACVVPLHPHHPVTLESIRAHCRSKLSPFKLPTSMELVDALPRSAGGRIQRSPLLAEVLERERMHLPPPRIPKERFPPPHQPAHL